MTIGAGHLVSPISCFSISLDAYNISLVSRAGLVLHFSILETKRLLLPAITLVTSHELTAFVV
jgi:hypothetical protein